VKPLAASATKRSEALPALPTFGEAGYPQLALDSWFAFFAPTATPVALRQQIHSEINKILSDQAVVTQLSSKGASAMPLGLAEFQTIVDKDIVQWGKAVRDSGAKID
jgi:tripartite-type tricarboxylate transporter receptor subunit TctC